MSLRIALLTHSVNPRGGVVHSLSIGDALQALGHQVTVFAPVRPGQTMFRATACKVEGAPIDSPAQGLADNIAIRIDAFVHHLAPRRHAFDVFHAQDGIGANALADLEDRGLIDAFVRTVHHLDHFDDARIAAWQTRSVHRPSQVFCVSRLWQQTLAREHGVQASLVGNGVDLQRYSAAPQPNDAEVARALGLPPHAPGAPGAPLVLAVGGVEARKNTHRLLDAFALLRKAWPDAQLVVAGGASLLDHDAYARGFHTALASHHLGDAVRLTGPLPDAQMPALLRLADVLAMPSLNEGFGLVVLEALASGTPAVVSRIAPFTEHLANAPVHWCDPLEPASIAAALGAAIQAPAFDAPPEVCRRFTWEASARRHAELYAHALQAHA